MYITEITRRNKTTTYTTETEAESVEILSKILKKYPYDEIFLSFMDENRNRIGYWCNFNTND